MLRRSNLVTSIPYLSKCLFTSRDLTKASTNNKLLFISRHGPFVVKMKSYILELYKYRRVVSLQLPRYC